MFAIPTIVSGLAGASGAMAAASQSKYNNCFENEDEYMCGEDGEYHPPFSNTTKDYETHFQALEADEIIPFFNRMEEDDEDD